MAEVNRYVDTDSGNAGNGGTSWLDAWDIMSTAEAQNQDLSTANDYWIVHLRGAAADTTAVSINGWTTTTDYYLEFRVDQTYRHSGKWDTTKYRLSPADAVPLTIADQYIKLTGLQIENRALSAEGRVLYVSGVAAGGSWLYITYCIIRSSTDDYGVIVLNASDADLTNLYVWNTVCHHRGNQADTSNNICINLYSANANLYNCTAYGGYQGIRCQAVAGTFTYKNCISTNTTSEDYDSAAGPTYDIDYCGSQDLTADDQGGDGNATGLAFTFVDATNTDFHLTAGSAGIDVGNQAAVGGAFTDDIDGVARSGTWDMGADEYTAGTTTAVKQAMSTYRLRKRKNATGLIIL